MHKYSVTNKLNSYKIDKDFVERIEAFVDDELLELGMCDQYLKGDTTIKINSKKASAIYHSVKEFKFEYFDDKIVSIEIVSAFRNELTYKVFVATMSFTKDRETSEYALALLDTFPESKIYSIQKRLLDTMIYRRSVLNKGYPGRQEAVAIAVVAIAAFVLGFVNRGNPIISGTCFALGVFIAVYVLGFRFFKKYTLFNSPNQIRKNRVFNWVALAIAGAFFSLLFTLLKELLFKR